MRGEQKACDFARSKGHLRISVHSYVNRDANKRLDRFAMIGEGLALSSGSTVVVKIVSSMQTSRLARADRH
jgi:hypothetical protein